MVAEWVVMRAVVWVDRMVVYLVRDLDAVWVVVMVVMMATKG